MLQATGIATALNYSYRSHYDIGETALNNCDYNVDEQYRMQKSVAIIQLYAYDLCHRLKKIYQEELSKELEISSYLISLMDQF